jgi:predicted MPP superfamily phosphohydrolase
MNCPNSRNAYNAVRTSSRTVRVERIRLRTTKLSVAFGPLKVVHISDVRLSALIGAGQLRRIVAQIKALDADLVVSTGDLVDGAVELPGAEVLDRILSREQPATIKHLALCPGNPPPDAQSFQ